MARIEFATPSARFSWAWKPTCASDAELGDERGDPIRHLLEDQRTRRIDHVHALASGVDHHPRLLGQDSGGWVWDIIKKPTVSIPMARANPKCWTEMSASVQ